MPCGSLRHIPRVVEVVRQSLHGPQLCLGEPLPRVRTRCNCWLDQARRCHEEAGQQTHQYVHADCVSNCMANGVLLHTVTCQRHPTEACKYTSLYMQQHPADSKHPATARRRHSSRDAERPTAIPLKTQGFKRPENCTSKQRELNRYRKILTRTRSPESGPVPLVIKTVKA